MRYARETEVSAEKSRAEIDRLVTRYGAGSFAYGYDASQAMVQFAYDGRLIRFTLKMPAKESFARTEELRLRRKAEVAERAWEQACRQRWRALALVIKAKLEAVETGITTFDEEFLAHIVMPDGRTIGEGFIPELERAIAAGTMPRLALPAPGGR